MKKKILFISIVVAVALVSMFFSRKKTEIIGDARIPYGSYGLGFTTMPKEKKAPRVIFLGNSVLQSTQTIPLLNKFKHHSKFDFEIGNFAITGATIADYIVTYNYVKKFKPDLLVIHLHPITFGCTPPLYRNESMHLLFLPEMRAIWNSFVFSTYTKDELVESLVYSYFPLYRRLPMAKQVIKEKVNNLLEKSNAIPLMDFFPYTLNLGKEWIKLNPAGSRFHAFEFPKVRELLKSFVDQLEKDNQKAIFIMQESKDQTTPICHEIHKFVNNDKLFRYYNFRGHFKQEDFKDSIHPNKTTGSTKVAARLLMAIGKFLKESGNGI